VEPKDPGTIAREFVSIIRDARRASREPEVLYASYQLQELIDHVGSHMGFYSRDPVHAGCIAGFMQRACVEVETRKRKLEGKYA